MFLIFPQECGCPELHVIALGEAQDTGIYESHFGTRSALLLKFPMLCVETSSLWSQAALLRYTEPRYESIGNTFLVHPDFRHTVPSAARRSRSFSHVSLELKAIQESLSSSGSSDSTDVIGSSDESATEDVGCTMMLRIHVCLNFGAGACHLSGVHRATRRHYIHTETRLTERVCNCLAKRD